MTKERDALKLALEALEWLTAAEPGNEPPISDAITAIREALDHPEQALDMVEPVAWRSWNDRDGYGFWETKQEAEPWCAPDFFAEPLYTSPKPAQPSKPWVGIDAGDWNKIAYTSEFRAGADWAGAKLREKNA